MPEWTPLAVSDFMKRHSRQQAVTPSSLADPSPPLDRTWPRSGGVAYVVAATLLALFALSVLLRRRSVELQMWCNTFWRKLRHRMRPKLHATALFDARVQSSSAAAGISIPPAPDWQHTAQLQPARGLNLPT